jgi:hypothetical protein
MNRRTGPGQSGETAESRGLRSAIREDVGGKDLGRHRPQIQRVVLKRDR